MGPRRLLVRVDKPTVGAVFAVLELFAPEILKCMASPKEESESKTLDALLPLFCQPGDPRVQDALEMFCGLEDPGAASLPESIGEDHSAALILARAALSLIDLPRIIRFFKLDQPQAAGSSIPSEDTTSEAGVLLELAEHFHVDPMVIAEWPFEALLSIREALEARASKGKGLDDIIASGLPGVASFTAGEA